MGSRVQEPTLEILAQVFDEVQTSSKKKSWLEKADSEWYEVSPFRVICYNG